MYRFCQNLGRDIIRLAKPFVGTIFHLHVLVFLPCLVLISCGGGGSAAGDSSDEIAFQPGLDGPGDSDNYFPYSVGSVWIYQGTDISDSGTFTFHNVAYVDRIEQHQGQDSLVVVQTNALAEGPTDTYLLVDAHGLATLGSSDPESPDALLSPYWNLLFPPVVGDQFIQFDRKNIQFTEDLDDDGISEQADIRSVVTVQGLTPVSTVLADYSDALHVDLNTSINLDLTSNNSQISVGSTESLFFVQNIGLVERQVDVTLNNETISTRESLAAYHVDGTSMAGYVAITDAVSEQQGNGISYFSFDAVKDETYMVALTGISNQADLLALLPAMCLQSNTGLPGSHPEDCLIKAKTERLMVAVEAPAGDEFVLSISGSTTKPVPTDEVNLNLAVDQVVAGQVGPRGRSRYAATALETGSHTVSILGLSGDADLHVFNDETYSFELDCTLRAAGDISPEPEECSVNNVDSVYFEVSSGELNLQGASFYILVH